VLALNFLLRRSIVSGRVVRRDQRAGDGGEGHGDLGGDLVAPSFGVLPAALGKVHVVEGRSAEPQVGQFVQEREDLRRLRVGAVDEDERCHLVGEGETAELSRVQFPVRVASDDPVDHDEEAECFGACDQDAECLGPGGAPVLGIEPEDGSGVSGDREPSGGDGPSGGRGRRGSSGTSTGSM
jgi:hypothetical protein